LLRLVLDKGVIGKARKKSPIAFAASKERSVVQRGRAERTSWGRVFMFLCDNVPSRSRLNILR
jgi:hypothetical protein